MQNLHKKISLLLLFFSLSVLHAQHQGHNGSHMPDKRKGMAAVVLNDKIWIIGGAARMNMALKTVSIYDPLQDKWLSDGPALLHGRDNPAAQAVGGKIYVFGGRDRHSVIAQVEMLDPQSGRWQTVSTMPSPRYGMASVVVDSSIWLIGGTFANNSYSDRIDVYDPRENQWSVLPASLTIPRGSPMAAVFEHTVYVFGGFYFGPIGSYERYEAGAWTLVGDMPIAAASCAYAQSNTAVWLLGGMGQNGALSTSQVFQWQAETPWQSGPTLSSAKYESASVYYDDKIYFFGGRMGMMWDATDEVEIFQVTTGVADRRQPPSAYSLMRNYPNPFRTSTTFSVQLARRQNVTLIVYDILGNEVRRLHDGPMNAGRHSISFPAEDAGRRPLPSGVYLARLVGERVNQTLKIHILK